MTSFEFEEEAKMQRQRHAMFKVRLFASHHILGLLDLAAAVLFYLTLLIVIVHGMSLAPFLLIVCPR